MNKHAAIPKGTLEESFGTFALLALRFLATLSHKLNKANRNSVTLGSINAKEAAEVILPKRLKTKPSRMVRGSSISCGAPTTLYTGITTDLTRVIAQRRNSFPLPAAACPLYWLMNRRPAAVWHLKRVGDQGPIASGEGIDDQWLSPNDGPIASIPSPDPRPTILGPARDPASRGPGGLPCSMTSRGSRDCVARVVAKTVPALYRGGRSNARSRVDTDTAGHILPSPNIGQNYQVEGESNFNDISAATLFLRATMPRRAALVRCATGVLGCGSNFPMSSLPAKLRNRSKPAPG